MLTETIDAGLPRKCSNVLVVFEKTECLYDLDAGTDVLLESPAFHEHSLSSDGMLHSSCTRGAALGPVRAEWGSGGADSMLQIFGDIPSGQTRVE